MNNYNPREIDDLASKILESRELYYEGNPKLSDQEFDRLEQQLQKMAPTHPVLSMVGSSGSFSSGKKVVHDTAMLSLAKTYDLDELKGWVKDHPVVATMKIDGNSVSLVYKNGRLSMAKTRGNGRAGEDVSSKTQWVSDCLPNLSGQDNLEVRGELYCRRDRFAQLAKEMKRLDLEVPSNPRNTVAGILGRKQHISLARYFSFAAFDVLDQAGKSPFITEMQKLEWLCQQGFVVPEFKFIQSAKDLDHFLGVCRKYMDNGDVGIDGIVLTYNDILLHRELGATSHHPRYKMSFKWQGETAVSTIREIAWSTSRLGIVTPVALIDPVYLSGASISNVTLHNAMHVRQENLKAGDKIEIVRSGEVIPKFLRVLEQGDGTSLFPEECPSCGFVLEFDEIRLQCRNISKCHAQQVGIILNWISCAEIDDLSDRRLTALIELGLVQHMSDLYRLTTDDFLRLPLTKEKMAKKLFANIDKSRQIPLARFLSGLGIQGFGLTTWETLLNHYHNLPSLRLATKEDIQSIDGFAEKSAQQLVDGLAAKETDIEAFISAGVVPISPDVADSVAHERVFDGKTFVITGKLSRPRASLAGVIKDAGGKVSGAVSRSTYALIIDDIDSASGKAKKARDLGVRMWSEETLIEELSR